MKLLGILTLLLISSAYGFAQEIPVLNSPDDFIIKRTEIIPSLSTLAPENPYVGKFRIRTVNFDVKDQPIQVNISEIMRQEEQMRYNSYVELAPPVQLTQKKTTVSFSANPRETDARYFNQNFNPTLPRTGTRNTVYKDASETTRPIYYSGYSPFYRRYY
tara:strand:+ start:431 stop:910 length:480 start_codon:yes stop_codon:yes gene_type:complete